MVLASDYDGTLAFQGRSILTLSQPSIDYWVLAAN